MHCFPIEHGYMHGTRPFNISIPFSISLEWETLRQLRYQLADTLKSQGLSTAHGHGPLLSNITSTFPS